MQTRRTSRIGGRTSATFLVACLGCLLLPGLLAGCSHHSVRHLPRLPWVVNTAQSLDTRFWTFEFTPMPMRDRFGLSGTARPLQDKLPPFASRIEELWLAAYLSDGSGKVIARDLRIYTPRQLSGEMAIPFDFILKPEDAASGQLFVAFGYRMVVTGQDETGEQRTFLASESSLGRI